MSRTPIHTKGRRSERGFILVTTVMFVLILSILGASLLKNGPLENSMVVDRSNYISSFFNAEKGLSRTVNSLHFVNYLADPQIQPLRPASITAAEVPLTRVIQFRPLTGTSDSSETSATAPLLFAPPAAGIVTVITTGRTTGYNGFGRQERSIQQTFAPAPPASSPYDHLFVSYGSGPGTGFQLAKDDTLVGKFVVSNNADSATLVNYNQGPAIPPDSVRVVKNIAVPDFSKFITQKLAGGYSPITKAQLSGSTIANPLKLGLGGSVYYSPSDLDPAVGQPAAIEVYGTVYVLVRGGFDISKEFVISAGNGSAALIVVAYQPSLGPSTVGLRFAKLSNANNVPTVMLTNADVTFLNGSNLSTTSIFGRIVKLAKDQYLRYNHAVLDPFLANLINSPLGIPIDNVVGRGTLLPISGGWTELVKPRF